ncbi:MAG TPA: hypothetical protein VK386_09485 [Acidimicrobiales bacterium]|nr:hypothetical protein [Acidimicrobiales bacterium]
MARPSVEFEFRPEDPGVVLAHMDRLGEAHRGWVNLQPGIREEDAPEPPTPLGLIFSSAVHEVPVCTWVAGRVGRHGPEPDSLGIQHATGPKLVARLASLDLALPEGWRWVQDHPRRGLVVRTPPGTDHQSQLRWLLSAGTALSGIPLTGDWRALVYEGRG